MIQRYALGLGANVYHGGPPQRSIARALEALEEAGADIVGRSRTIASRPLGPGRRDFANAVAIVETNHIPSALLTLAKDIEKRFGRRRGRPWGDRVIDIDIILWSGGMWAERDIAIPHPAFRDRTFVMRPLAEIAADWRDPVTGLSVRQLHYRLNANSPVDRTGVRP